MERRERKTGNTIFPVFAPAAKEENEAKLETAEVFKAADGKWIVCLLGKKKKSTAHFLWSLFWIKGRKKLCNDPLSRGVIIAGALFNDNLIWAPCCCWPMQDRIYPFGFFYVFPSFIIPPPSSACNEYFPTKRSTEFTMRSFSYTTVFWWLVMYLQPHLLLQNSGAFTKCSILSIPTPSYLQLVSVAPFVLYGFHRHKPCYSTYRRIAPAHTAPRGHFAPDTLSIIWLAGKERVKMERANKSTMARKKRALW